MSQKFANAGSFIVREDLGKPNKGVDRVQKGFTAAYPTQSSIPYRQRRSVIPESEKRGFNSQARRFYSKKDDIPGPGFYNVIHQSPVFNSVSLSKRGTCTFPSTCARLGPVISKYPAANAYTIRSELASKKDFSNSCSSMFQLPTFIKVVKSETPAPNHYNASISICKQRNNVCARAGFLSKTPRGFVPSSEPGGPAPGHYDVNESLVRESPKVLVSCFKSKTGRGLNPTSIGPGPGYYNPNDQTKILRKSHLPSLSKPSVSWLTGVEKVDAGSQQGLGSQIFRTAFWHGVSFRRNVRKTTLLNFSAQPLPLPEKPPLPGPGQYEIVNYQGPPKHFISTASFVSNTSRWPVKSSKPILPGPASYKPEIPGKQSFLYNEDNKWIPAV